MGRSKSTRRRTCAAAAAAATDTDPVGDVEMSSSDGTVVSPSADTGGEPAPSVSDGGTISSDSLGAGVVDEIDVELDDQSLIDELEADPLPDALESTALVKNKEDPVNTSGGDSAVGTDVASANDSGSSNDVSVDEPVVKGDPTFYESVSLISEAGRSVGTSGLSDGFVVDAEVVCIFSFL